MKFVSVKKSIEGKLIAMIKGREGWKKPHAKYSKRIPKEGGGYKYVYGKGKKPKRGKQDAKQDRGTKKTSKIKVSKKTKELMDNLTEQVDNIWGDSVNVKKSDIDFLMNNFFKRMFKEGLMVENDEGQKSIIKFSKLDTVGKKTYFIDYEGYKYPFENVFLAYVSNPYYKKLAS